MVRDFVGGLDQRCERVGVQGLWILFVAAHRPGPDEGWIAVTDPGHFDRPAFVVLVLDHAGDPAGLLPKALFENVFSVHYALIS
jgi:hypothetical protein